MNITKARKTLKFVSVPYFWILKQQIHFFVIVYVEVQFYRVVFEIEFNSGISTVLKKETWVFFIDLVSQSWNQEINSSRMVSSNTCLFVVYKQIIWRLFFEA